MQTILVVGIETVAGANLSAFFAEKHHVVGLSAGPAICIQGCTTSTIDAGDLDAASHCIEQHAPAWIVYCGNASRSAWEVDAAHRLSPADVEAAAVWAEAARLAACPLTVLSSDAVFTGPWMFHDEDSPCTCDSPQASLIRDIEQAVVEHCPDAFIVRTNIFGWAPEGGVCELDAQLTQIRNGRLIDRDFIRHATPILATDLADILERGWQEGLTGLFHVGGAERVSPLQFAQRLANHFELPWLALRREDALVEKATGFGAGETSLQTKKVRKALCVAMPMLSEGLARLRAQQVNGFRDRLGQAAPPTRERVA